jgi:hypothetical protein
MKYGARIASSACLATTIVFSLSVLFYSTTRDVTPVHAEKEFITGSVSSSPTSGPVGAMISISGSGWPDPDGEQVSFGYMIESYCSIVPEAQAGTFNSGSFSGSLQLPNGTPLGTYQICATFGSTTANANTYTVLTESSPQVSISFSTQKGKQQATISGSNFLPAGTTVNLFWETTIGNVIFTITPAVSDSNGLISRTFIVSTTIKSGSYKIVASVGGQQPTLSASAPFTYKVPTPPPTPTPTTTPPPTPLPATDPTPTQQLTPTTVPTTVVTAISTPTIGVTALVGSQNTNTGQTPSSHTTSNDPNTNQSTSMVLIGSITGGLALLATTLIIGLFIRRKKARSIEIATAVQPTQSSPMSWQNNQLDGTLNPITKGSIGVSQPWPVSSTPPSQQQLQISPYTHLLHQPERGNSALTSEAIRLTPDDPNIETIKRQVQMGLFATSGNRRND